jgi:muconate cycloisomerase
LITLTSIDVYEVRIPFRTTFRHHLAARSVAENIIVRVRTRAGHEGFGESVPRSYVTGESQASVVCDIQTHFAPLLLPISFDSFEEGIAWLKGAVPDLPRNRHAAWCAVELAIVDLLGRAFGIPSGSICGPILHTHVFYSGILSADGLLAGERSLLQLRDMGFRSVKLKVGKNEAEDLALLTMAREILGDACSLRVDANCAWKRDEALQRTSALMPLRVVSIEQPLSPEDLSGMSWLTARSPIPIMADESLVSIEDARHLIENRACHSFNLRISKCGGLLRAARVRDMAMKSGISCQLGSQVGETAILSAAGRQLATRSNDLSFLEGSFGDLLLQHDIATESVTFGKGGLAPALPRPGLGITIDENALSSIIERSHHMEVR